MVRVAADTFDHITAWRIRDALALHPLLGGASADIRVIVGHCGIVLEGWTMDDAVRELAVKLALRAAGRRIVSVHLTVRNSNTGVPQPAPSNAMLMQRLRFGNAPQVSD